MPRRLNVRGRRSVVPASVWVVATEGGAARRVGARREQLDELLLLVGPVRLDRAARPDRTGARSRVVGRGGRA